MFQMHITDQLSTASSMIAQITPVLVQLEWTHEDLNILAL